MNVSRTSLLLYLRAMHTRWPAYMSDDAIALRGDAAFPTMAFAKALSATRSALLCIRT
jgi:hypothetical protein